MSARFSIVVTCYNQNQFIRAAIDSALSQNPLLLLEIIVVDDQSTDGSRETIEEYGASIKVCALPQNLGAVDARNQGSLLAQGEYLVFLDGDDILMPWALDVYEPLIIEQKPIVICGEVTSFSGPVPKQENGRVPSRIEFATYPTLIGKDRPMGMQASSFVVHRETFWKVGGWTSDIFQLDLQDLSLKLSLFPLVLILFPATAFYRIHTANSILSLPPFIRNLHRILAKERSGQYPGGPAYRVVRSGWLGGLVIFWIRRALRGGLYKDAAGLLAAAWPMIMIAVVRRLAARIRGRQPIETIDLLVERS